MEGITIVIVVAVIWMIALAIFVPIMNERDLIKKVFFKSDKVYWDDGGEISYSVCLSMTKQHSKNTIYCDFEVFRRDFNKVKTWRYNKYYDSMFGDSNADAYIHASVLSIREVGYLPINQDEFRKISMFIRSYIDLNFK